MSIPEKPKNSFRITLELKHKAPRLDALLLEAIRGQEKSLELRTLSRTALKALFNDKKILIKGQAARPSSNIAAGTTYVDIVGFSDE